MEREMGAARNLLLAVVKQFKALTSGKIELKPVEERDQMKADDLLECTQDVAGDIDFRRQILNEGLKGISKLEENYADSRQQHEKQQQEMEEQFEKMAANLEDYQQKMVEAAENAEIALDAKAAGAVTQDQGDAAEHLKVVATQRDQLQLLSNRVKVLQSSDKELQGSNDKMYEDLDTAVKRLIPLGSQIEELRPYAAIDRSTLRLLRANAAHVRPLAGSALRTPTSTAAPSPRPRPATPRFLRANADPVRPTARPTPPSLRANGRSSRSPVRPTRPSPRPIAQQSRWLPHSTFPLHA